jgi:hypothetical protein
VSENPPPGFDEIHGSLTAPLLPSLDGSDVLGAPVPEVPLRPTNPTLPTLDWNPTAPSSVVSKPPPPRVTAPDPPIVSDEPPPVVSAHMAPSSAPQSSSSLVEERSAAPSAVAGAVLPSPAVVAAPVGAVLSEPVIAAGAPALPTLTPVPAPTPASSLPPTFASAFDTPTAKPIATHRVRDAVGGLVRTLFVAALVAGAVFGGRYVWDWNEDRHSDAVATEVLPATPVPAANARFVQFRGGPGASVTAHVDLATSDYVAEISATQLARRSGEYWMRDVVDGVWVPASAEFLERVDDAREAAEQASVLMITDVIPVEARPYATVSADEVVTLAGEAISGPEVIDVHSPDDGSADPTIDGQQLASVSAGVGVVARHLTLEVDRMGLSAADPALAEASGLGGTSPLVLDIWVDATGVVRKLTALAGGASPAPEYELISVALDGAGPLADLGLPGAQPAPAAEGAG